MRKIAIVGSSGRMGKALIEAVAGNPETVLAGALEMAGHSGVGLDAGTNAGLAASDIIITDNAEEAFAKADAIIDFTAPEATIKHLEMAAEKGVAMVIGTTGLSREQQEKIKTLSEKTPVVFAPNMSVGVNVLLKLVALAAKTLGDGYDVEIVESHHRLKKDAPSGTALRIAEVAAESLGRDLEKTAVYERHGMIGERRADEIGIQTIRAGDIVGDHTIMFAIPGERIELTHKAQSRSTFALGAVRAAIWLAGKERGLFDMHDVLGLKD